MKKRKLWRLLSALTASAALMLAAGCGQNAQEEGDALIVFNYGDYIDVDTIKMFEEETGIDVKYEEYITPEDMYTKYQSGAIAYDLICTSDYMVEKMMLADELCAIDTEGMENYQYLDGKYLTFCQTFDENNEYAVPYLWGTVGICYNTDMVEEEIDSWSALWDEKYENQIIMENSMRDAFLVPLKLKGYSLNTADHGELLEAQSLLMEQKPLVEAYLVDESRDAMIAGDAAVAVVYSGDATEAMESNDALVYTVPKEGSNIWFDCWMIPKSARHKEEAEQFIDFMNRPDIAMMNFEYIYYGTPNAAVYEALDEETKNDRTIFPEEETLEKCEVYRYLGEEADTYYNQLWKELKAY